MNLQSNAKLSYPDQASELLRKVVFYTDRKSEQNRHAAARGWLQRLVSLILFLDFSSLRELPNISLFDVKQLKGSFLVLRCFKWVEHGGEQYGGERP